LGAYLILSAFGTYKKFGMSRLYLSMVKDRREFMRSLQEILEIPFVRLSMAHGDIMEIEARKNARDAAQRKSLI
jgi:hypothetical protein